jgi:hypothetical protein
MSSNLGETNFCVWEKARQSATQATPVLMAPESSSFYTWRKRQIEPQSAKSTHRIETRRKSKGGKYCYFNTLLLHKDVYSFSSPSTGRVHKRAPELVASPQSTALHSTGNTTTRTKSATTAHVE